MWCRVVLQGYQCRGKLLNGPFKWAFRLLFSSNSTCLVARVRELSRYIIPWNLFENLARRGKRFWKLMADDGRWGAICSELSEGVLEALLKSFSSRFSLADVGLCATALFPRFSSPQLTYLTLSPLSLRHLAITFCTLIDADDPSGGMFTIARLCCSCATPHPLYSVVDIIPLFWV